MRSANVVIVYNFDEHAACDTRFATVVDPGEDLDLSCDASLDESAFLEARRHLREHNRACLLLSEPRSSCCVSRSVICISTTMPK